MRATPKTSKDNTFVGGDKMPPGSSTEDEGLRFEERRLSTFQGWPADAKVEPQKIAKAGFFYMGQYTEAKCRWCGCVITTWDYGDQVMTRHRQASPDCSFVRNMSDNVPMVSFGGAHLTNEAGGTEESSSAVVSHSGSGSAPPDQRLSGEDESLSRMMDATLSDRGAGRNCLSSSASQSRETRSSFNQAQRSPNAAEAATPDEPCYRQSAVGSALYHLEEERLNTFRGWPLSFIRPADLANAGFVYKGISDRVECVFCGGEVGEWTEEDFPHTEHRSLFPNCPFMTGEDVGNVPVDPSSEMFAPGESYGAPSEGEGGVEDESVYRIGGIRFDLATSSYDASHGSRTLRDHGYDVTGVRGGNSIYSGPEKGPSVLQLNGKGPRGSVSHQDIGIIQHSGPANPQYSTFESRMRTFNEWPPAIRQKPKDFADAGFFYIGLSDQVKCFYCDGGLRNWQTEDDPWVEHARWFTECGYVRLIKGDEFISKCIQENPPQNIQGVPAVALDRRRRKIGEEELQRMMSSPLVNQVLQAGVDGSRIKRALKQKMEDTGTGFKLANDLMEAALSLQLSPSSSSSGAGLSANTSASAAAFSGGLTRVQACGGGGGPDPGVSENFPPISSREGQERKATSSPKAEAMEERSISSPCGLELKKAGGGSGDLEQENQRLKDQRTCRICMDNEIGVVFLPCGHLICCVKCAPSLKDCPYCRQPIQGSVKTYMS